MSPKPTSLTLFEDHRSELLDYATRIVGNRAHAEDIVQEAWLRFHEVADSRPLAEPLGYLYRVVRNVALDDLRRKTREGVKVTDNIDDAADSTADDRPSPEAEAIHRQELQIVEAALAALPERTRIALEMHRFGGFKLRQIAEHLGISTTLVHVIIAEGVEACRRSLREKK